jgi:dethiobiotin synthetase
MNLLVTGTGTGVGKTFVTSALIRSARTRGIDCVGMKPICSGGNEDVLSISEAMDHVEPDHLINPVWFRTPAAPYPASVIEDRLIDLEVIFAAYQALASRHAWILVEGVGGLAVPITRTYDFRDLARDFELGVVVITANRLGTINHTRLTVEALKIARLECKMVILSEIEPTSEPSQVSNYGVLQDLLEVPVVWVEHGQKDLGTLVGQLLPTTKIGLR